MHLLPNDDQDSVRTSATDLLSSSFGPARAHDIANGAASFDPATWQALAGMGWFGLGIPEDRGGAGLTAVEEAIVFKEAGRALAPLSVLATVLGAHAAALAGADRELDALLSGSTPVALMSSGRGGDRMALEAVPGASVMAIEGDAVALTRIGDQDLGERVELIDPATTAHRWIGPPPSPTLTDGAAQAVKDRAALLSSAYLTGIGAATLGTAVAYAKDRVAFGKRIGAFQAVKHRLATAAMNLEAADAQVVYAAAHVAEDRPGSAAEVDAARILSFKAALETTGACIQAHGALGVTWEFDAHIYLARARLLEFLPHGPRVSMAALSAAGTA